MSSISEGTNKAYSQDNTLGKMPGSFASGPNTPLFDKTASLTDDTYRDNIVENTIDSREPSYSPMQERDHQNARPEKRDIDSSNIMHARHNDASYRSNVMKNLTNAGYGDENLNERNRSDRALYGNEDRQFMTLAPEQNNGAAVLSNSSPAKDHVHHREDTGLINSTLSKLSSGAADIVGMTGSSNNTQNNKQRTTDVAQTVSSGVQSATSAVTDAVNSVIAPIQEQLKQATNDRKQKEHVGVGAPNTLGNISNKIAESIPSFNIGERPADQLDEVAQRVQKDNNNNNNNNMVSTPALSEMEKQVDRDFNNNFPTSTDTDKPDNVKVLIDQDQSLPSSIGQDRSVALETNNNQSPLMHKEDNAQPSQRSMAGGIAPIPKLPTQNQVATPSSDIFPDSTERSNMASPPLLSSGLASNTDTPGMRPLNEHRDIPRTASNVTTPAHEPSVDPIQGFNLPSHEPRGSLSSESQIPAVLSGSAPGATMQTGNDIKAARKSSRFELPPFNKEHSGWTPDVEIDEFTKGDDDVDVPMQSQQRGSDASNNSVLGSLSFGLDKLRSGVADKLNFLSSPQEANKREPDERPHHMKDVDVLGSVDDDSIPTPITQAANEQEEILKALPMTGTPSADDDVDVLEDQKKPNVSEDQKRPDESEYGYAKIMLPPQTKSEQRILSDRPGDNDLNSARSTPTDNISTTATIGTTGPRDPKIDTREASPNLGEKTMAPPGALSNDAPRIPSIEKLVASGSNTDRLSDDIERKLADMSVSHKQPMQGPVQDNKQYSMPSHVKSVIYHDHAAEDAYKNTESDKSKVRKGFENFTGLGVN